MLMCRESSLTVQELNKTLHSFRTRRIVSYIYTCYYVDVVFKNAFIIPIHILRVTFLQYQPKKQLPTLWMYFWQNDTRTNELPYLCPCHLHKWSYERNVSPLLAFFLYSSSAVRLISICQWIIFIIHQVLDF